jgi:hypothetical protein
LEKGSRKKGEQRGNKENSILNSNGMKIIIHCPPENIDSDEKKRVLASQRIQEFRIPIDKNEAKDRKQFLYFYRGQYKYNRCDPGLIEVVEKIKEQSIAKKGRWEGPWDILEFEGDYSITLLDEKIQHEKVEIISQPPVFPSSNSVVATVPETEKAMDYHPSRYFATWSLKIQRVNRQFFNMIPFPIWLYNIRNVHSEMDKTDWIFIRTKRII